MQFDDTYSMIDEINDTVEKHIRDNFDRISTSKCGLDVRAGTVYINDSFIAVHKDNCNRLNYYGGFEYCNQDYVTTVGDYVFFSSDDDRVMQCIDDYNTANADEID